MKKTSVRLRNIIFSTLLPAVALLSLNFPARADRIQLGSYSGRPGHFAKIGNAFQLHLNVLVMNQEVHQDLAKASSKLGGTRTCEVEGAQQRIGAETVYTLYKIKNCEAEPLVPR